MKRRLLRIIALLALGANLCFPGLAFSQETTTGSLDLECTGNAGVYIIGTSFTFFSSFASFVDLNVENGATDFHTMFPYQAESGSTPYQEGTGGTPDGQDYGMISAYDTRTVLGDETLPADDNCRADDYDEGYNVTAQIEAGNEIKTVDDTIPSSNVYIATTDGTDLSGYGRIAISSEGFWYYTSTSGDGLATITAPLVMLTPTDNTDYTNYTTDLSSEVTLIDNTTGIGSTDFIYGNIGTFLIFCVRVPETLDISTSAFTGSVTFTIYEGT